MRSDSFTPENETILLFGAKEETSLLRAGTQWQEKLLKAEDDETQSKQRTLKISLPNGSGGVLAGFLFPDSDIADSGVQFSSVLGRRHA